MALARLILSRSGTCRSTFVVGRNGGEGRRAPRGRAHSGARPHDLAAARSGQSALIARPSSNTVESPDGGAETPNPYVVKRACELSCWRELLRLFRRSAPEADHPCNNTLGEWRTSPSIAASGPAAGGYRKRSSR